MWMRSAISNTCGMLWLIRITGSPLSRTRLMSSSTWPDSLTPSAAVGSSMITSLRAHAAARATATPWRWPPDSVSTAWLIERMPICRRLHLLVGLLPLALVVEHAQDAAQRTRAPLLATEEQVGRDVQRRRHREVLVDRLDARLARVVRGLEVHLLAVEADRPLVRDRGAREHLDQARLAGAVVPDHGEDLAGIEVEVGAVDGGHVAVALVRARVPRGSASGSRSRPWSSSCSAHARFLAIWSTATAVMTRMPVMRIW